MNYKQRPGIVKVKLCGMNVLIPTRQASAFCTTLQALPTLWSATWEAFGRGATVDSAASIHALLTKKSPEACREKLERFCRSMVEKGFMIEVPEEPSGPEEPVCPQLDELQNTADDCKEHE